MIVTECMQGGIALTSLLKKPNCRLKVVDLSKCQLGLFGLLTVLEALAYNNSIEKLNLSENAFHDYDLTEELLTSIQQLSFAISMAKQLRLLDLSKNGFCEQVGETFYNAWSIKSRGGCSLTRSHINGTIIHLSVEPIQCCNIKSCCTSLF